MANNEQALQVRASLGKWEKGVASITIRERKVTPQMDLRTYFVREIRQAFSKPYEYNLTERDVIAKVQALTQSGYRLSEPLYPELKEFFRNGKPITAADELSDAMDEIKGEDDGLSGIDFLLANWN